MSVFQFCLHGLSPGDCTMAIQPLDLAIQPEGRTPSKYRYIVMIVIS